MDPMRTSGGGTREDRPHWLLVLLGVLLPLALVGAWAMWKLEPGKPLAVPRPTPSAAISEPLRSATPEGQLEGAWAPAPSDGKAPVDIRRVGGSVESPKPISRVQPVYPELARLAGIQGVVIVEAVIDEHGDVTQVRVLKGLPMGLSTAAVDAVRQWKFSPATYDGRPVAVYFTLTVNFKLQR